MGNKEKNIEGLLKAELKKEAEEIFAEISKDDSLQGISVPEDMDDKIFEMIQKREAQKAAYDLLDVKDQDAIRIGREMQILKGNEEDAEEHDCADKNEVSTNEAGHVEESVEKIVRFSKKKKKIYLIVAAVAIMTLAVGMTSIGGAPFISKIKEQLIGDREMVKINTDRMGGEGIKSCESNEVEAYRYISDTFGIEVARLGYKPEKMEFLEYTIDKNLNIADVLYTYGDTIAEYQIIANYGEQSSGYNVEVKLNNSEIMNVDGVDITIKHYGVQNAQEEYIAQFKYNNLAYSLRMQCDREKFIEIIKKLQFF